MEVIASEHPPSPLLQKLAPPFLCVSKASRAFDTLAETPLLDEDVALKPCTGILNAGSPTLTDKASRLDICEEKTKWLQLSSNDRASGLPGKTPGEHNGCVRRGGESRGACNRDGYPSFKGRSGSSIPCMSRDCRLKASKYWSPSTQDATLKRCFGTEKKIIECDWDFLSQQQTLKEPHASMPRLTDLLEYLAHPGLENVWLLLDIKVKFSPTFYLVWDELTHA